MDNIRKDYDDWIDSLTCSELDDLCEKTAWKAWQQAWTQSRQSLLVQLTDESKKAFQAAANYGRA